MQNVVVLDIPGTILHADKNDNVHMPLEGTVVEMIIQETHMVQQTRQTHIICTIKKTYTGCSMQHYCSGNYNPKHSRGVGSHATHMPNV